MRRSSTFKRRCGTNGRRIVNLLANAPVLLAGAFLFESGEISPSIAIVRTSRQPEGNLNSWNFSFREWRGTTISSPPMSPVQSYLLRRTSRLALVAVMFVFWFGGEQTCHASCGDYLVHPSDPSHSLLSKDRTDAPHRLPTTPCRGANCSRRSEVPPLPTRPTVETTSSLEWACLMQQIRDQHDESSKWSLESDKVLARHMSHRLKRPPRS